MQLSTKVLFSAALFLLLGFFLVANGRAASSFDLFGSMNEARDALMSFYKPLVDKPDDEDLVLEAEITLVQKKTEPVLIKMKPILIKKMEHVLIKTMKAKPVSIKKKKPVLIKTSHVLIKMKAKPVSIKKMKPILINKKKPVLIGLDGRRPVQPLLRTDPPKRVQKKPVPQTKPVLTNKFVEALEDIEKALAEAQQIVGRITHDAQRLKRLQDLIKSAVQKRSYRFARKAIGEAIYTITKMNEKRISKQRGKRETVVTTVSFLGDLIESIGEESYSDLLAMKGQVTLMFTIDKTGSMQKEIDASKKIAESIVNQHRNEPVDYILSPFSDPESACGPVSYYEEGKKDSFVTALKNLKAVGGWDCPELTFKGIIDALNAGPQEGSPMYVMTDAGPKDATEDNMDTVVQLALVGGYVVNFFIFDHRCSQEDHIKPFNKIAQETSGQVFRLKDEVELEQLAGLAAASLGGTAIISNAAENVLRKRRSTSNQTKRYSIPVDDSIDTLVISVTTDKSRNSAANDNWGVSLASPSGSLAGVSQKSLDKGTLYQISNPSVGVWNLGITSDNSINYDYYAKATSDSNIDFEYYFVKRSRRGASIPINNPLQGEQARAILTLGGMENINKNSLHAELLTLDGELLETANSAVSLKSEHEDGFRQSFTFTPPGQLFKIKLKGKTKKGNPFERISHNIIKSETLLVKVVFARNDFTIPQGATTFLLFLVENYGNNEAIDVRVFGSLGKVQRVSRNTMVVRKRRKSSFSVTFSAQATAEKGVTITIVVNVKGKTSGSKSTLSVPLLVV